MLLPSPPSALFSVDAAFSSEPRTALKALDKNTRIALVELQLLDATSVTISQIRSAAPRARIIVTVDALPSVERRAPAPPNMPPM